METDNNTELSENNLVKSTVFNCASCNVLNPIDRSNKGADDKLYCSDCFRKKFFVCSDCGDTEWQDEKHEADGEIMCSDCFHENWEHCNDCGNAVCQDDCKWVDDNSLCEKCYSDNYFRCDSCDNSFHNDNYGSDGLCEDCHSRRQDEEDNESENTQFNRKYHKGNDYVDPKHRAYSCEIESYYNDFCDYETVAEELPEDIGISEDGSLKDKGKEFQTPKLSGKKGEKLLKDLCISLVKNNFYVDKTCGLHIHLDTSDIAGKIDEIKRVMLFYLFFEPVIYSYLPFSRRTNRYCMPLAQFYHEDEILNCDNVEDLEKVWYREQKPERIASRKREKYDNSRYAGVNIHSLLSNGHIEIRHHSGTIDYTKIKNWIDLHLAILDKAQTIPLSDIVKVKFILDLAQRQDKMFEMLDLKDTTKSYFLARSKKFGKELTEEIKCVE